jgi:hypothetical protein
MKKQPTAAVVVESSAVVLSDAMQSFFPSITFRLTVRIYSGEIIIAVKEEKNDGLQRSLTRIKKLMSSSIMLRHCIFVWMTAEHIHKSMQKRHRIKS